MITINKPTAYPEAAPPGPVLLRVSINSTDGFWGTVRVIVYEGSLWSGHGTQLWYQDKVIYLSGLTNLQFLRTASEPGTIDRRDVRVQVFGLNAELLADEEWDDIYYVTEVTTPDLKVLEFDILGEEGGGYIEFNPPPIDYQGHYEKDTLVTLTAKVNPGFVFVRWQGEVNSPLSTSPTNTVTMSENRLVKAEFALAQVERIWPLEVDITPSGGGYVTTSPAPEDITNHFTNGTIGKFAEGIRVSVRAHPAAGFEFWKWTDEIQGGVSFNLTEWVSGVMDEHKAVKAHFRVTEGPPDEPPPECVVDTDCPVGYVCQNGVCVPEEPPPDEEEETGEGFPWLPALLLVGGGAVVVIAISKPKK